MKHPENKGLDFSLGTPFFLSKVWNYCSRNASFSETRFRMVKDGSDILVHILVKTQAEELDQPESLLKQLNRFRVL